MNTFYRVSTKTVSTFVFWISRLPKGLEISSWTFFNCPFRVDFKNIRFFIIWWNLAGDICKILWVGHFKNQHFLFIFGSSTSTLMNSHELLGALMCTYLRLWPHMSIHKYSAMSPIVPMSANECSWPHGTMLITAHELSWVLIVTWNQAHEHSSMLMSTHEQ